jgi:hypothetical protein
MNDESHEPETNAALATCLEDSFFETRRLRHDGWDGPTMAAFCRTLAETGVVTDACRACGKSAQGAYALRQREPVFALAWEAAISLAREKLSDELLARSLKGSVEQIMNSDGAIVGERHSYDNRLAFSVLRRLDRRTELGATFKTPQPWAVPDAPAALSGDWQLVLDALSEERKADAELLLTPVSKAQSGEIDEVDDPRFCDDDDSDPLGGGEPEPPVRVWHDRQYDEWRTDFPAPRGFDGDEYGEWDDPQGYSRTLTDDEMAALVAAGIARPDELVTEITIEDDEAERDRFFESLSSSLPRSGGEGDRV